MADYGAQDTSTTSLGANQFPISEAWTPNAGFSAVEGGTQTTDAGGKKSAPVRMEVKDGSDVAGGSTTDLAVTGDNPGTRSAKLRGLLKIWTDVWDSVNHHIHVNVDVSGSALAPYGSNPAQTAAAGADTLYKFGASGTTSFSHVSGQNNTPANVLLAFDQSTTIAGNQVYVLAPGQAFAFDRQGTILHFSSSAQQAFGGQSGITVEAFA